MAFLYGDGENGKGTFIGAVAAILKDYAVSMPIEAFTANHRGNLEYYRAQMVGARLVTASETESGALWAEAQIKELTGNEAPVSARNPYGRPSTYRPQFKLVIVGNHAPRLKGRSRAMERRLRIVPFRHKPRKADHTLKDRLRAEYPAILRWVVQGCLDWQCDRLGTCAAVAKATSAYFEAQDAFGRWLAERCDLAPTFSARPSALVTDYRNWAQASGEAVPSAAEFRELLERTPGLRYATNSGIQWVRGIGLKPDRPNDDPPTGEAKDDPTSDTPHPQRPDAADAGEWSKL